ncbi:hypothetical protein ABK040_002600 [Willaertia magna]
MFQEEKEEKFEHELELQSTASFDEARKSSVELDREDSSRPSVDVSVIGSVHDPSGHYAQLDKEGSKPVTQRNPYISLLFYNRRFLLIWMAGVLSGMGNYFSEIGVLFEVEKRTNLGIATSGVFLCLFAPSVLAFPFAGVVSDVFDRRKVLVVANILRAILAFMLLLTRFLEVDTVNHWWLFSSYYVILGLIFFINAFYDASRGVLLPLVVDHNDLVACNALDSLTWLFCSYTGAAIGGFVTQLGGLNTTYICNGLCFIGALILTLILFRYPELNPPKGPNQPTKPLEIVTHAGKELLSGFKLLFSNKGYLLSFTLMKFLGSFVWASVEFINVKFSELPVFVVGNAEMTMTIGYCLFGIGSGLGPMVCELLLGNRIRRSVRSAFWMRAIIVLAYLAIALGFCLMFFSVHAAMFITANFIIGCAGGILWVYSTSCIEHLCPNSFLGRVTAFDICFGFGAGQALGVMVPSPLLYDVFSVHTPHLFAVVMFCLGWVLFVWWVVWFYLSRNIHQHHVAEGHGGHEGVEHH